MSKIKVIDNFLGDNDFKNIQNNLMGDYFPWYYNKDMTFKKDNNLYFTHTFYLTPVNISNHFYLFENMINKFKYKSLLRIKGNLYVGQKEKIKHEDHTDYDFKHKGCIFYINNNNGETYFGKEKVLPVANRIVFFDPSTKHSSSSCNDSDIRITINFNYF
tara:strand:- start:110 stop:589 length:480 start_codon:yes stop_codon:yes gene_type:complete